MRVLSAAALRCSATRSGISSLLINASAPAERAACWRASRWLMRTTTIAFGQARRNSAKPCTPKSVGSMLPTDLGVQGLAELRLACPNAIVVVLISHLDARQQAALSAGADAFISKDEMPERVAEHLRAAAESTRI